MRGVREDLWMEFANIVERMRGCNVNANVSDGCLLPRKVERSEGGALHFKFPTGDLKNDERNRKYGVAQQPWHTMFNPRNGKAAIIFNRFNHASDMVFPLSVIRHPVKNSLLRPHN